MGLAEPQNNNYLRFDPALVPTLLSEMGAEEQEAARITWAETMQAMTQFLKRQQISNSHLAYGLASWELPSLLTALQYLAQSANAADVIAFATTIEALAQSLGSGKVVLQAARIRKLASDTITDWSYAAFEATRAAIDRLLDSGRFMEAIASVEDLLRQCETAGQDAYNGASYDMAMAYFCLGRTQRMSSASETAIAYLQDAEMRFTTLAQTGVQEATYMASLARTERADCLRDLGRLEEAAQLYVQAIRDSEQRGDVREMAVEKGSLGTVRMLQRHYADALQAHHGARDVFEQLGEPRSVAEAWHQIGMVSTRAGNYLAAQQAHQNTLQIARGLGDLNRQANSLNELGTLYHQMERYEEAVCFYREATAVHVEQRNLAAEGRTRSNAALVLLKIQLYDEARSELERAVICKAPFGHTATPWNAFAHLYNLEGAVGNEVAAQEARQKAIKAYLAYRREHGESTDWGSRMVEAVAQALAAGQNEAAARELVELLNDPKRLDARKPLLRTLQRIVSGERNMALADAPELYFMDAVELRLLLETLAKTEAAQSRPPVIP